MLFTLNDVAKSNDNLSCFTIVQDTNSQENKIQNPAVSHYSTEVMVDII